jgi:transcriptional regulator with XRE-family HTH domain
MKAKSSPSNARGLARTNAQGASVLTAGSPVSPALPSLESIDAVLAKNLIVARAIAGITQQALAHLAGVSRATIAQLETGYSDPRLSTIVDLSHALGISPVLLLIGDVEAHALVALSNEAKNWSRLVNAEAVDKMRLLLKSGMLKDRLRAAKVGAATALADGESSSVCVSTGIFSAIYPGPGTFIGRRLGLFLSLDQVTSKPIRGLARDGSGDPQTSRSEQRKS